MKQHEVQVVIFSFFKNKFLTHEIFFQASIVSLKVSFFFFLKLAFATKEQIKKRITFTDYYRIITENKFVE